MGVFKGNGSVVLALVGEGTQERNGGGGGKTIGKKTKTNGRE